MKTLNFGIFSFPRSLAQTTLLSNISHLYNTLKVGVVVFAVVVIIAQNQNEEKTRRGKEFVRDRERALLYTQRESVEKEF